MDFYLFYNIVELNGTSVMTLKYLKLYKKKSWNITTMRHLKGFFYTENFSQQEKRLKLLFFFDFVFMWYWATHPLWLVPALQWWRHELHQQGLEEQEEVKQQGCVLVHPAMHLKSSCSDSGELSAPKSWMFADTLHGLTPNLNTK